MPDFESSLSKTEKEKVQSLLKSWGHNKSKDIEEDCCGTASYHYKVIPSGIGDGVFLVYGKKQEFISDDNY